MEISRRDTVKGIAGKCGYAACVVAASFFASGFLYMTDVQFIVSGSFEFVSPLPLPLWAYAALSAVFATAAVLSYRLSAKPGRMLFESVSNAISAARHKAARQLALVETMRATFVVNRLVTEEFKRAEGARAVRFVHEVLAYGKLDIRPELFSPEPALLEDGDAKRLWKEEIESQMKLVEDVTEIWRAQLCNCMLGYHERRELRELGEHFGIPAMLDAYKEGVPVSDILAG